MADIKKAIKKREELEKKRVELRKKLREEHRCTQCKKKVEPSIYYHEFCEKHREKLKELRKLRLKNKRKNDKNNS